MSNNYTNPLAKKLEDIADWGSTTSLEDIQTIREAATEIEIASGTVQAATTLGLTMAEKYNMAAARNDELLQRISDEVEAHRVTKELLAQAMETARRGIDAAEYAQNLLNKETTHE
jgi:hypothetical protein